MYTYNKNDKSYTFSSDELSVESIIDTTPKKENDETNNEIDQEHNQETNTSDKSPKKIEIISGGNDLDISPVSDYLEIEKPKMEKKENIIVPENKN